MTRENLFLQIRADAPFEKITTNQNLADLTTDGIQMILKTSTGSVIDSNGKVNFPSVYGNQLAVEVVELVALAPAQPQTHDYTVRSGDSLWTIAKDSLSHGNRNMHFQGEEIWDRVREIIAASTAQHPELKGNPFFIKKGDHLTIPGQTDSPVHNSQLAEPVSSGEAHLAKALKHEATRQARHIDTVGDCARGPRLTLEAFGIKLKPMSAVSQGKLLEQSGMFDVVPASQVKEGDYGYRHWSARTIKRRGVGDLGDSFILTDRSNNRLKAANDHIFHVPAAGSYYAKGITYLRPNEKFYDAVDNYRQTGHKTHIDYGRNGEAVIS